MTNALDDQRFGSVSLRNLSGLTPADDPIVHSPVVRLADRVLNAAEADPSTTRSTSGTVAVKIEDRPLADPYLPKVARSALVVFCLVMIGAFMWAMGAMVWGLLHPLSWFWIVLCFGYFGWNVWSDRRKAAKRRQEIDTNSKSSD